MPDFVTVERRSDIAVVTLDNPPVNAFSLHLRQALQPVLAELRDDDAVAAIVIACAGRTFVSGADITEFGTARAGASPNLPEICALIETMAKPVVAAIHGTAFGGGLELAMACHHRVAHPKALLGLPEVKLGLLPGSGGTVRLPRLVPAQKALAMITSGNPIGAAEALAEGLVDAIAEGDLVDAAVAFARGKIGHAPVPVRDREARVSGGSYGALDGLIEEVAKKARGLEAPVAAANAVRNALRMPFDIALKAERDAFLRLVAGDQSRAQRHLFFAEREAQKVPGIGKDVAPRAIRKAGVIGAGTMGGGIAMALANGGIPVTIVEMSQAALDRGLGVIAGNYDTSIARGSLTEAKKAERMARLSGALDYSALADCDLIIEAVFEEMAVKKDVFGKLDAIAKPGAILATNTSYLDVNEIAASTSRPHDVIGLHFFSPANVMKLLEIVRGDRTAPDVVATALALARQIGKVAAVVGVCPGFVGNRMLAARSAEGEALLLEGALPHEIDDVFTGFGWPMGPFAMSDLAGLDIGWRNRKSFGKTAAVADALCEDGRFGQKTGKGYYRYDGRKAEVDPEVTTLIEDASRKAGVTRRAVSAEEITERTMFPLVNEGARILEEKIASRPSDIDLVWANGYGFPVGKGGPMFWADLTGLPKIVAALDRWHEKTGRDVFAVSPLLRRLAETGGSFSARPA
jgi:3-hydroxyacyl-CoA dehydrogenase